ncbi:MAG: aldo/keto reductase [Lunatimonas sp.]|uniref:aldo/keto reductase n=1 Tax=Lunatimonas sp. TaxID=2060141 RepID=UPI00263B5A96|nr:aldo/keto reductase [Lunatimonas sp.]MCC5937967.1 aldo/keto reductase [Lunatimonas sp.]
MDRKGEIPLFPFGRTGLSLPRMVFGSSDLGNLYREMPLDQKLGIIRQCLALTGSHTVFDSAGKYGAGLALEVIGECLHQLGVPANEVVISNKLGWVRTPLKGPEPTFEPGIWKGLKYDAIQKIGYRGIIDCFEEGNELLKHYVPQLVSVHDPDEYLDSAPTESVRNHRFEDILEAYRALGDLKREGRIAGIGVGAKNWRVIPEIYQHVELDWVMVANSLTLYEHPDELLAFIGRLEREGVAVINAAVFNGGFLVGGDRYNYQLLDPNNPNDVEKLRWRRAFHRICYQHDVKPSHACIQFGMSVPGINSVALSTVDENRVVENFQATQHPLPAAFWQEMKSSELLPDFSFL